MDNKYGLSDALWDDLSLEARAHFNRSYEYAMKYKDLMCHPKMKMIGESYWKTIAFNQAYLNACLVNGDNPPIVLAENNYPLMPN